MRRLKLLSARVLLAAALALVTSAARAQTDAMGPEATRLLKRMTDYLAGLQRFTVDTHNTLDAVLASGQKVQFVMDATVTVQRPNRLFAERKNSLVDQKFYYDGKTLTLSNPKDKVFATVAAPPTLEAMLDFARERLDIVAPAADLLYADAYEQFMQVTTSGFVVGKAMIGGVRSDQLAFRGPDVDWQIWIADGPQPLPYRYVVTTRGLPAHPEYSLVMTRWDVAPNVGSARFTFTPQTLAKRISFLGSETEPATAH
jgi:hypothetical protein